MFSFLGFNNAIRSWAEVSENKNRIYPLCHWNWIRSGVLLASGVGWLAATRSTDFGKLQLKVELLQPWEDATLAGLTRQLSCHTVSPSVYRLHVYSTRSLLACSVWNVLCASLIICQDNINTPSCGLQLAWDNPWSLFSLRFDWIFLRPQLSRSGSRSNPNILLPPILQLLLAACFDILLLSQCLFIFDAAIKLHCGKAFRVLGVAPPPAYIFIFFGWTFCLAVNMSIWLLLLLLLFMLSMTQIKLALSSSWVLRSAFVQFRFRFRFRFHFPFPPRFDSILMSIRLPFILPHPPIFSRADRDRWWLCVGSIAATLYFY